MNRSSPYLLIAVIVASLSWGPLRAEPVFPNPAFRVGLNTATIAIGDFNRDERQDVVAVNTGNHGDFIWVGTGDGTFGPDVRYGAGLSPSFVAVGDFNEDDRNDIVVVNSGDDDVSVLINRLLPFSFEADGVTLRWPAVAGARSYNIYRGDLAELVDADVDGQPDGGYGACASSLDLDPSDTRFVDEQPPDPKTGFFYLMSVVGDDGAESTLGMTSGGAVRQVLVPCP